MADTIPERITAHRIWLNGRLLPVVDSSVFCNLPGNPCNWPEERLDPGWLSFSVEHRDDGEELARLGDVEIRMELEAGAGEHWLLSDAANKGNTADNEHFPRWSGWRLKFQGEPWSRVVGSLDLPPEETE